MPHDVIMPALGMAQDTGKIVSWLKEAGDPVKAGEAIMEVETDKATMEVEAQADGFLTGISAGAGDDVPVGQIVATISETAEGAGVADDRENDSGSGKTAEQSPDAEATAEDDLPEGQCVIMPALGMAQDTGLIVAWRKDPGDAVKAGDVLLEVETDKSVMEVEAGQDGFVAAILAQAQEAVPVGSVIAIISANQPETPIMRGMASASAPEVNETPGPAKSGAPAKQSPPETTKAAVKRSDTRSMPVQKGGRILASPKARRLALEQGLELSRLVEQGHQQPFHVADLNTLRALPPVLPSDRQSASPPLHLAAKVSASGCDDFARWFEHDTGTVLPSSRLWLSFAAAALRQSRTEAIESLVVGLERPDAELSSHRDPDISPSAQESADQNQTPDLTLRDFSDSMLTAMRLGPAAQPVLTVLRDGENFTISLDFQPEDFGENEAIRVLTSFAERLREPLHHIL
ncbi:biotin/lipoyl-containing protein [Hoeflea sp.]|uniref:biotin/lipoyl-containing protein n=1 Tax=Hoeflea sp. TaxID=1940281 RepID=UPI003B519687